MSLVSEPEIVSLEAHRLGRAARFRAAAACAAHVPLAQVAGAVFVCTFLALLFLRNFYIADPDIWWHLATGRWILEHHSVPMTEPFSSFGMGKPWVAYSWLFDLTTELLFRRFGYLSFVYYEMLVRLALAAALFRLVRSLLPHFWRAAAVTVAGLYAMSYVIGPRPGMLTILFGIIELDILLSVRRTGAVRKLWLLPPMLAIWANWHIQFVYGLLILGIFACEPLLARLWPRNSAEDPRPMKQAWFVLGAGLLATFLNPYGPRLYSTVFQYLQQPKAFSHIVELRAMTFRESQNYAVLLLFLSASMAVGWRREKRLLWPLLLAIASVLAFRSVKETWFLAVISAAALADGWEPAPAAVPRTLVTGRHRLTAAVWVLAVLFAAYRYYGVSSDFLEIQVNGNFPEPAARYVQKHHLTGSLYNDFNWGGYLIWRLPQLRVAIDGRTNVHGDERVAHFADVWTGKPAWASDAELSQSKVVLANKKTPLASLLRLDQRFQVVYEDVQAVVFERR